MENISKSRYFMLVWVVLIIAIVTLAYLFILKNPKNKVPSLTEISGQITEIKDGSITVSGLIGAENRIIEFDITNAEFIKASIMFTSNQLSTSGNFQPETKQERGSVSDLAVGKKVIVESKENLLDPNINKATAMKINYMVYVLPN